MFDLFNNSPIKPLRKDGVYFHPQNDFSGVLSMTATTDFNSQATYQISTQPTADTLTVTDNITRQPRVVSVNGVVVPDVLTGVMNLFNNNGSNGDVATFVNQVNVWREQKRVITLFLPEDLSLEQCFITGFEVSRDKTNSTGLNVQMQFTEILAFPQQVGQNTATVKEGSQGSGSASSGVKTSSKGSVTTKSNVGNQATTDTVSMEACKNNTDYFNNNQDAMFKNNKSEDLKYFHDSLDACQDARLSGASKQTKINANNAAESAWTKYSGNKNKV
ncbi:phage baseplate protein [Escherichia coli]|uniref:phage baseplate protein n=1 Tax=Escherichia coli TaxID=562 RepID=UPI0037DD6257